MTFILTPIMLNEKLVSLITDYFPLVLAGSTGNRNPDSCSYQGFSLGNKKPRFHEVQYLT